MAACPGTRAPGKTLGKISTANNNLALAALYRKKGDEIGGAVVARLGVLQVRRQDARLEAVRARLADLIADRNSPAKVVWRARIVARPCAESAAASAVRRQISVEAMLSCEDLEESRDLLGHFARAVQSYLWNQVENGVGCPTGMAYAAVAHCPTFFQEYIEKDHELRITIVGDEVFWDFPLADAPVDRISVLDCTSLSFAFTRSLR